MKDEFLQTRAFILQKQLKESHEKRDPLKDIDSIYVPPGAEHQWGQQKDPARSGKTTTSTNFQKMKGNESGPSDSDDRLESQEGNSPTKPDTEKKS